MWAPEVNVFDETKIKTNITDYFIENQVEALAWAADASDPLPEIAKFHRSPREMSVFPALTWLQTSHTTIFGDLLVIEYNIVLDLVFVHGNQNTLADRSPRYAMALESMISNVPEATFNANSIITIESILMSLDTVFDMQRKQPSGFSQAFQTKASWQVTAPAMNG